MKVKISLICGIVIVLVALGSIPAGDSAVKYGSSNILFVILATALATGIVNYIFFPHVQLLGASGVVFAFILLSPFTSVREGSIPITLVLVAALYIGGQIYSGVSSHDNVSHLTHIIGGCVGAGLGYVMHKNKMNRY